MKNITKILLFVGVTTLFFSQAQSRPGTTSTQGPIATANSTINTSVAKGAQDALEEIVLQSHGASSLSDLKSKQEDMKNELRRLNLQAKGINSIGGRFPQRHKAESDIFIKQAKVIFKKQETLSNGAIKCCTKPESCLSNIKKALNAVMPWATFAGALGLELIGGGGGVACLKSLPTVVGALGKSKGTSRSCKLLKDGGRMFFGVNGVYVHGSVPLLKKLEKTIKEARLSESSHSTQEALLNNLNGLKDKISTALETGQSQAETQSQSLVRVQGEALECGKTLLNLALLGDDGDDKSQPNAPVDCGNVIHARANPEVCRGYYSQTQNSNEGPGLAALKLDDDFNSTQPDGNDILETLQPKDNEPSPNPDSKSPGGETPVVTNSSGGGGPSGKQETGAERGTASKGPKGKNPFLGFKESGSSPSSGLSPSFDSGKRLNGWKSKNDEDKEAVVAFERGLADAGISPDSSGSIFERISNRFKASIVKENLFDCRANQE